MTKKDALVLSETKWWEHATDEEIVRFQLFEPRLCMPPDKFKIATETVLGHSIFVHEFWYGIDGLKEEFLEEKEPATMEEIINLLPEEARKNIIWSTDEDDDDE